MASVAKEWREIPGRYNLIGTKCGNCGKIFFPSRDFCPVCRRKGIGKIEKYSVCRTGEIYTYTVIYDAPDSNVRQKPYAAAMVRTDDGVLISGQLVDVDFEKIDRIEAAARARIVPNPGIR